ncbi:hypothetical protein CGJ34_03590 [Vibrio parahaemolyticus]|uniref:hypothetical protein n=1 Tax=Vibrio parahaemolyticus TaxID=670 RepID=UPI00112112BC|nr:hypothetical protein [Vibrio parahaemolyticus]TOE86287.1 hypothetical protein CGJ34_03590 [Vibrio parahaemolyticus]
MTEKENKPAVHKTKTLHYRYASIDNYDGVYTLSELLKQAFSKLGLVKDRYQEVNEDPYDDETDDIRKVKLFVNNFVPMFDIQFGDLMRYADGTNKSIVTIDNSARYLKLEMIAPTASDDGKRREFLDSILYFGAFKNHVAIIQSAILRTSELERHLNWLLKKAEVLPQESFVFLTRKIPETQQKKLDKANTKTLKFGAPLVTEVVSDDGEIKVIQAPSSEPVTVESIDTKNFKYSPSGIGLNWLLSAFGDMKELEKFGLTKELLSQDALQGSDLKVSLEVSYKRKASKQSQTILNQVSRAFRHTHPDEISVQYDKVGKLNGRELSLEKKLSVKYVDGVIDAQDLYPKIREWLKEQIDVDELVAE